MFQTVTRIIKWVSLPVLLTASIFSRYAAAYEGLVDLLICMGATVFALRVGRLREYYWAAGFVAIAIVFSPLELVLKVFLLMAFTCVAMLAVLLTAFRPQPAMAVRS